MATPPSSRELAARAADQAEQMETISRAFARELQQVLRLLDRQIRGLLDDLQRRGSRLVTTRDNLRRAVTLRRDLSEALTRAGYSRLAERAVGDRLDTIAQAVLRDQPEGAARLTRVDVEALAALRDGRLADLLGLGADAVSVIWRTTLDGVLGARPLDDLVDDIADVLDVSARQARVYYDTAVSTYARQVQALTSEGTPDELFVYVGPVDRKTRAFCRRLVGRVLTRAEIDELDNGIVGYPNVFLSGGGPNCRHQWRRVSRTLQPELAALAGTRDRIASAASALAAIEA